MIVQEMTNHVPKIPFATDDAHDKAWKKLKKTHPPINFYWHGFKALTKKAMYEAETHVHAELVETCKSKFRCGSDFVFLGYVTNFALLNNYAMLTRNGLSIYGLWGHFGLRNYKYDASQRYDVVCINYCKDISISINELMKWYYQ